MIEPTVGRIVLYRGVDGCTRAAIVAAVHGPFLVNLQVFGLTHLDPIAGYKENITHADRELEKGCVNSWDWMPYQKGQAAKTEQAEAAAAALSAVHLSGPATSFGQAVQSGEPLTFTNGGSGSTCSGEGTSVEAMIQAKGKTAPRVTPADIEAEIVGEYYARGPGAVSNNYMLDSHYDLLNRTTYCVLIMRNGFTVTGESTCVDLANFNADLGRKIARQNAVEQIWPLLGFRALQSKTQSRLSISSRTARRRGGMNSSSRSATGSSSAR